MMASQTVKDYVQSFLDFLNYEFKGTKPYKQQINEIIAYRRKSLLVDFNHLYVFDQDLANVIISDPVNTLRQLEDALYQYLSEIDPEYPKYVERVHIRLLNLPRIIPIRNIRSVDLNKLIVTEGIVVKQTPVMQKLTKAVFKHISPDCNAEFQYPPDGEFDDSVEKPSSCPVCGKHGKFVLIKEKSQFIDWQKIVLQEMPEDTPSGQIPRQIEVYLEDDLVDTVRPGDRIKVTGILSVKRESQLQDYKIPSFEFVIKANSIDVSQKVLEEVKIADEDIAKIRELSQDPFIIERIVKSIAPSIYGNYEIKEAIALALFGGTPRTLEDGTKLRGDIHVLIIGDPGTAKSQLLQFAARVAPRAIYATGKGSTAAGLTAAVTRDEDTGNFYLEAGVLVLADGGVAVIDEIDKMSKDDRAAIHEAMEQQTVSIAKAGIVAKLNARTTIIAAGNPKFGRYIRERNLSENIDLPPSILSRFDLIFVLVDTPSNEDVRLAEHVTLLHSNVKKEDDSIIPPELLRKYIAYARKNVFPELTDEARKLIVEFYTNVRMKSSENQDSPIIITPRQLEALIRISEAYAKMRLKNYVGVDEAERAINIMRTFLQSAGLDVYSGKIDIDSIMTGKPKSIRDKTSILLDIIQTLSGTDKCATIKEIIKEAEGVGITRDEVSKLLLSLSRTGYVYELKSNCYRVA